MDHPATARERLIHQVKRLREEAVLDDRAAERATNPDVKPFFTATAVFKRQFATDIETLLNER